MEINARAPWLCFGGLPLSAVVLVLANLAPVFGVFFLGWTVFPIVLFFWLENVAVGVFNVLKMLIAEPSSIAKWLGKVFLIPFFCFHYGMFTMVHGVFVFTLFGAKSGGGSGPATASHAIEVLREQQILYPAIGLFLSHGFSFFWNYLGKGEYRRASLQMLMASPYGRVIVLHLTILLGGFLMMSLKSPAAGLLLLVALKIVLDVKAHLLERKKFAEEHQMTDAGCR